MEDVGLKSSLKFLWVTVVSVVCFVFGIYLLATAKNFVYLVGGWFTILGALFSIIFYAEYCSAKGYERWKMKQKK